MLLSRPTFLSKEWLRAQQLLVSCKGWSMRTWQEQF